MSYYKPKRRTYKKYAKKGISKAAVKTMITKNTDWSYFIRNEYKSSQNNFYLLSLTNKDWTETGKIVLKHLQLRFNVANDGNVRAMVIQSEDKLTEYESSEPPAFLSEILTELVASVISTVSCVYPDNKKYKILMDKTYLQDANGNGSPQIIQRNFTKMSPMTLSSSAATPVGHIYLLIIAAGAGNGSMVSSVLKYST